MRVPGIISHKQLQPGVHSPVFSHMDLLPLSKYSFFFVSSLFRISYFASKFHWSQGKQSLIYRVNFETIENLQKDEVEMRNGFLNSRGEDAKD